MSALDPNAMGIQHTYERKLKLINMRYPDSSPTQIITKLLGADVNADTMNSTVTDEQGGKLLACYLISIRDSEEAGFLSEGIKPWLEEQQPKYPAIFPAQKACLEEVLSLSLSLSLTLCLSLSLSLSLTLTLP